MITLLSFLADSVFGDPEWRVHPVRIVGRIVSLFDKKALRRDRIEGVVIFLATVGISAFSAYLFTKAAGSLGAIILGYFSICAKDLREKAKAVLSSLREEGIDSARKALSEIVSRDTEELDREGITKAAVESVAESTTDGIIAPLFYLALGGPIAAWVYRTINTADSMVGYKTERYRELGWASAKADDIVNYIPARITALLIALVSRKRESISCIAKFRKALPSPNQGYPISAMAGALGIRLGGPTRYFGRIIEKPEIGEGRREIEPGLIEEALKISSSSSILFVVLCFIMEEISTNMAEALLTFLPI
jgi:adenosylcobinamide-phosphate synthase